MIGNIINNLRAAAQNGKSFTDKILLFQTLTRLQLKSKFIKKRNVAVSESIFGYKIFGYDHSTINYLFHEVFMTNEYRFQASTDSPLIIDCGANIGMSVLYFKTLYPKARIIAFEANPHAARLLADTISANNFQDVVLHNIALYDKETEISFFIGDNMGTLLGSIKKERGGGNELKIPTQRLSHFLKDLTAVDLIKIDVEGAEINVLNDLVESATLQKSKAYIVEYHHNMNEDKSNLASFLQQFEANGFNYKIRASFADDRRFQDILIHFYK